MQGRLGQWGLGLETNQSVCTATQAKGYNNEECGGAEEQTNNKFVLPIMRNVWWRARMSAWFAHVCRCVCVFCLCESETWWRIRGCQLVINLLCISPVTYKLKRELWIRWKNRVSVARFTVASDGSHTVYYVIKFQVRSNQSNSSCWPLLGDTLDTSDHANFTV